MEKNLVTIKNLSVEYKTKKGILGTPRIVHAVNDISLDIKEGENEYTLEIEMPGIKKENIKIELSKGYITISAENNNEVEEKEKNYIRKERHYGSFSRSFYVGDKVEMNDIKASMDNGILSITVPKEESEEPEKKYIEIK